MALATRCPHCHTTFRVANDQLKLRAGLVRCGACKQIFNGIEHLLPPEAPAQAVVAPSSPVEHIEPEPAQDHAQTAQTPVAETSDSAPPASSPASPATDDEQVVPSIEPSDIGKRTEELPSPVFEQAQAKQSADDAEADPLTRMTLMDFRYPEDDPANGGAAEKPAAVDSQARDVPDPLDEAIEALQRKPLRGTRKLSSGSRRKKAESDEFEEPSFVKQGRRRQRYGRALRITMAIGSLVLLIALLAQGVYAFRNDITARFPDARPALAKACAILGCQVSLPTQIDAVSIESSELQALVPAKNIFAFTFLLRNRNTTMQAWPNIELTLNDANEKPIARRVFLPRDYLPAAQVSTGFAAGSEQSFKLSFELSHAKATGYRVYVFYP